MRDNAFNIDYLLRFPAVGLLSFSKRRYFSGRLLLMTTALVLGVTIVYDYVCTTSQRVTIFILSSLFAVLRVRCTNKTLFTNKIIRV